MATARDWVQLALRANGALAQGETLENDDAEIALGRLNMLLDSWSIEPGVITTLYFDNLTLAPTVATYSSALLSQGRPVGVKSITINYGATDYNVDCSLDETVYERIPVKTTPGIPDRCFINTGFPNLTFYFYPVPYAAFTARVGCWGQLTGALTLNSVVNVAPGYTKAIVDALAVDVASSFQKQPSRELVASAVAAKAWVKRGNVKLREMQTGLPTDRRRIYNIYGDE